MATAWPAVVASVTAPNSAETRSGTGSTDLGAAVDRADTGICQGQLVGRRDKPVGQHQRHESFIAAHTRSGVNGKLYIRVPVA